ncbi:MAG: sensor histidine kinase [Candidatus Limnocylindria bacterium]
MPDDRRDRWHGRGWGPSGGRKPPWWPEGEAWPPADGQPWRRARGRFMRRAAAFFLLVLIVLAILVAVLAEFVTSLFGGRPSFALTALLGLAIVVIVAGGLRRMVRRTAVPVGDLVEAAGRIEAGEIGTQVNVSGPAEVRTLGRAFNAMSSRLEETDASRRRLLADVSHELRTPLTVMQGTLEGILDGVYPADEAHLVPVLEETRVLARLIDDLRTLSLSEVGVLRLHREPTDLGRLIEEVVAGHRAAADDAGVTLSVEAAAHLPLLEIDPSRIRQVIGNLVANALRFTPRGGRVVLEVGPEVNGAWVRVSDTGAGIEPDALAHVFDRFYRSPGSSGSGLGLPIARNLVEAHGGIIGIESPAGGGTEVRFTLPASFVEPLLNR